MLIGGCRSGATNLLTNYRLSLRQTFIKDRDFISAQLVVMLV